MQDIVKWLFEARLLKEIPRSGYAFLGMGRESVAEHSFSTTVIAYAMGQLEPRVDPLRLITDLGQSLAREILKTNYDAWWQDNIIDRPGKVH